MTVASERERTFWGAVDRSAGPDACWLWTGAVSGNGYGSFWWPDESGISRNLNVHQIAFLLTKGWRPTQAKGVVVRHSCARRLCCNPAHLSSGNQRQNSLDEFRAGRPFNNKLTELAVRDILRRAGTVPRATLAADHGVSVSAVKKVIARTTWTWVSLE